MILSEPLIDYVPKGIQAEVLNEDSFKYVNNIDENSIKLVATSPPYNIGKVYETKVPLQQYINSFRPFIKELYRITSKDGSVCWQVGNFVDKGEVIPLDILFYPLFLEAGFKLRNRIIWQFGHGLHASKRFSGRYETILWFTKSDNYTFNLDSVRIPSKYPGKRHFKGENKGQLSGNPLGKNPEDVWTKVNEDWDKEIWDIPNVKANHPEKSVHPCQFPIELVERLVLALTEEGDLIFDPFAGVGSTIIASLKNRRNSFGIELDATFTNIANFRIQEYRDGKLKPRPITKRIHFPSPSDKVAQYPKIWE
jgi:adenine-specific DNA-methyltransferase